MLAIAEVIQGWSTTGAWFAIGLSGLISLFCFFSTWASLKRFRAIADTPLSKVRSAAQGYVALHGKAQMLEGEPILSPLTRSQCCWWQYRIEHRVRSGRSTRWATVESGTSEGIFALDDNTGRCLVDPDGAQVLGSKATVWNGGSRHPGATAPGLGVFGGSYRYTEEVIYAGDWLYAIGNLRTETAAQGFDLRKAVVERLRRWKQDQQQLLLRFDSNGDGQIDELEWEKARQTALSEVEREHLTLSEGDPIHIIGEAAAGQPYILGTQPPTNLKTSFWRRFLISALCFLAFGMFATWVASLHNII